MIRYVQYDTQEGRYLLGDEAAQPPSGGGAKPPFRERLTVLAPNSVSALTYTPIAASIRNLCLEINGVRFSYDSNLFNFNFSTNQIDLSPLNDYGIEAGWEVWAEYYTDDAIDPPVILSISPTPVTVGDTLTITGENFTPSILLTVGGIVNHPYTFVNSTTIELVISALLYSGSQIVAENPLGVAVNNDFQFLAPLPSIVSFSPTAQSSGLDVVITGANFYNVSNVSFGGSPAASFTVDSLTQITATVGTGADGDVEITTMYGAASLSGFDYVDMLSGSNFFVSPTTIIAPRPATFSAPRAIDVSSVTILPETFSSIADPFVTAPTFVPLMNRWFVVSISATSAVYVYEQVGTNFVLRNTITAASLGLASLRRVVHVGGTKLLFSGQGANFRFGNYNFATDVFTLGNLKNHTFIVQDAHYWDGKVYFFGIEGSTFNLMIYDAENEVVVEKRQVGSNNFVADVGAVGDGFALLWNSSLSTWRLHNISANTLVGSQFLSGVQRRIAFAGGRFWLYQAIQQIQRITPSPFSAQTINIPDINAPASGIIPSFDGTNVYVASANGNYICAINTTTATSAWKLTSNTQLNGASFFV